MKVIRPHCRLHLTAADVDFVLASLQRHPGDTQALRELLADDASRDAILDSDLLRQAVLERAGCLSISPHLYFYVLVRGALVRAGVNDRDVADYIAELLAEFTRTDRTRAQLPGAPAPLDYFCDMLAALPEVDPRTAFALRTHMGNQALYYSGLFSERIARRAERKGFPDVGYYERLGEASFAAASHDRWADRLGLAQIFAALAACFHEARLALNDLAERLLSLGDHDPNVERLLIRVPSA